MARPQRSFSDAINEGLLGLGNAGFQYAQAANEKRRTDAAMAQSDAATKATQAETKLRESEFARGLRQDSIEKSLADATKARMSLPQGVRADMPSDDEIVLWSQLNKTSPEEARSKIMRNLGEAAQVGLENKGRQQALAYNTNLQPLKLEGERLGNRLTESQIAKNYADANALKAKSNKPKSNLQNLTEKEKNQLSDFSVGSNLLNELAGKFKSDIRGNDFGKQVGSYIADVAESVPLIGGKIASKTRSFNDLSRITAETMLRAATGANAPEPEVKFYENLLPKGGMSNKEAQSKLDAFMSQIGAKAKGTADRLRLTGDTETADQIEQGIDGMLAKVQKVYSGEPSQGPKPGDVEEGHRFKGGNPADPNNWEKL